MTTLLMTQAHQRAVRPAADRPTVDLDATVTARWLNGLAGARPRLRRHWETRVSYYSAVARLLDRGTDQPRWSDVIQEVRPTGSRTTFYKVTGAHAKHSLVGYLIAHASVESMQLALSYRREGAVAQLVDEAKVWAYWPYREQLSIRYQSQPDLTVQTSIDLLMSTVDSWARGTRIAAALSCAPPVCAVEDLLLLTPGRPSAVHVIAALTNLIRHAIDGPSPGIEGWRRTSSDVH